MRHCPWRQRKHVMIHTIAFDADDTLWHNMPLFTLTHEKFRQLLMAHSEEEDIPRRLMETEIRNLRQYGYGIKGFTLSMIETALELTAGRVTGPQIAAILDFGKQMLASPIELLPQVRETVTELAARYQLMLLTKGDLFDQEVKLARSGLGDLFHHIDIVSEKDTPTYARILARYGLAPPEFVMVGNSVKSDILPVLSLGARAVFVPYHPTWVHEEASVPPTGPDRYAELPHLGQLPALIDHWAIGN